MEYGKLKRALEGILFAAGEPVTAQRLCLGLETDRATLDRAACDLAEEYEREKRGIRLLRLEGSYQLCSAPEQANLIRRTLESRKPPKLSQPALEVLAVVAYFQPVTRAYIDRGPAAGTGADRRGGTAVRPGAARAAAHHQDVSALLWTERSGRTAAAARSL